MNKYEKLSLEGLLAMDEEASKNWCYEWENAVKKTAKKTFREMNYTELEAFYKENTSDNIDPWFEAWDEAVCSKYPFDQIFARLDSIETTLDVILKAIGAQPANITIAQLSRLKGGN